LPTQPSSRNQDPAVDYFYSAAKPRSRGVLWPGAHIGRMSANSARKIESSAAIWK
jgi:hypothetical protein